VYLPVLEEVAGQDLGEYPASLQGQLAGGEVVLFIEDEEMVRQTLSTALEHHGYTVLLVETGTQGLEIFMARQAEIDLVILDLSLPGMSGYEVLRRLRAAAPQAKVIIATGYALEPDQLEGGARHFVQTLFDRRVNAIGARCAGCLRSFLRWLGQVVNEN